MSISLETLAFALLLTLIAGFINGSYATPTKYMTKWHEITKWFFFAFFGMLFLPWITVLFMAPNTMSILTNAPLKEILILAGGGILFGLGQICFALAFRFIGIGLNFVVNISIGTACTALISLATNHSLIGTTYSYLQILGVVLFVIAVVLGAIAGNDRDKHRKAENFEDHSGGSNKPYIKPGYVIIGVILAIFAGIGSACEGVAYVIANPSVSKIGLNSGLNILSANTVSWVVVFTFAFIPYILYFLYLCMKEGTFSDVKIEGTKKYWFYLLLMGLGYWGSLVFFSGASSMIGGELAPTIVWPLFMVFIILTSNFWSFISGEWTGAGRKATGKLWLSITLFIVAVVIFSISAITKPNENNTTQKNHFLHYKKVVMRLKV